MMGEVSEDESAVVTALRVRPMSDDEKKAGCRLVVSMQGNQTTITDPVGLSPTHHTSSSLKNATSSPSKLSSPAKRPSLSQEAKAKVWRQTFTYDHSFWSYHPDHPQYADQQCIFDTIGTQMLTTAWKKRHCSLFAYGQTGAGKSFTMMGKHKSNQHRGLIPRICHELFSTMAQSNHPTDDRPRCTVKMTFVEIYNDRVYDLLNPQAKESLKVREHPEKGTHVEHVSNLVVTSSHDIEYLLAEGSKTRTVASTHMNQVSSRSHAILTLSLHWPGASNPTKLSLVDLAGSERTEFASGDRLREAASINKSLSALGDVINALATNAQTPGAAFVQYRNSILTRLLKDSLSGSSRLIMLAAISPCCIHYDETLSTLKYVERAKLALAQPLQSMTSTSPSEENDVSQHLRMELTTLRQQLRIAQQNQNRVEEDFFSQVHPEDDNSAASTSICLNVSVPHLVNLNQDPRFTERVLYCLEEGITTLGSGDRDLVPDILLLGHDVLPLHGVIHCTNGLVSIRPAASAPVFLNGKEISQATQIDHEARLVLGSHHVFRFDMPHVGQSPNPSRIDWNFAHNELLELLLPQKWHNSEDNINNLCDDARVEKELSNMHAFAQSEPHTYDGIISQVKYSTDEQSKQIGIHVGTQCEMRYCEPQTGIEQMVQTTNELEKYPPKRGENGMEHSGDEMHTQTQTDYFHSTASTQYTFDSGIQFDENDKFVLERKIAKLKVLLKKKDKQLKRGAPTPTLTLDAIAYDTAINDKVIRVQQLLNSLLGKNSSDNVPLTSLQESILAIENQALALQDLWNSRPDTSKSLAWLFQELSSDCKQQFALWSQTQTLQLTSAAKVVAHLEARFASLCSTLNEQCNQEKHTFEASFQGQTERHEGLLATHVARLSNAQSLHRESMSKLEATMAANIDAVKQSHMETQQTWLKKIEQVCSSHIQELTSMSVQAALEEDKAKLKLAEWESKCASLVAEAEMVLCETRAMHAKELRDQQDAVAIRLYDLEMQRMAQEEKFLHETEAFVRSMERTLHERHAEQAAWNEQKQIDLMTLHTEHEEAVQQIYRQHEDKRERLREELEVSQMTHEERWAQCMLTCTSLQNCMADAVDKHLTSIELIEKQQETAKNEHAQAMAARQVSWDQSLKAIDAAASNESLQHVRFMKQLVQRHAAQIQHVQQEILETESTLAKQDAVIAERIRQWNANLDQQEGEYLQRLQSMEECHKNILHDLRAAFESQQAKRHEEVQTLGSTLETKRITAQVRLEEKRASFGMEIEDVEARHAAKLAALRAVQINMPQSSESSVVDSYREQYDAKQIELDERLSSVRRDFSSIEQLEVEKHKKASQAHAERMAHVIERGQEEIEQVLLAQEELASANFERINKLKLQHQLHVEAWQRDHDCKLKAIEAAQLQMQRHQEEQVAKYQANLQEIAFAYETTCMDIQNHHEQIMRDYRLLRGQMEERWMQEVEDSLRKQEWVRQEVQIQCANQEALAAATVIELEARHQEEHKLAKYALICAEEAHARWCMAFEEQSSREHLEAEDSVESQWDNIQLELDFRERDIQTRIQALQRQTEDDTRRHEIGLRNIEEAWTENLTTLHMQKEDVISTEMANILSLEADHARIMQHIHEQLAHYEQLARDDENRKNSSRDELRMAAQLLGANQQAFFDDAIKAIDDKWQETEAMYRARAAADEENRQRMLVMLEEAHATQRVALENDRKALEGTLKIQLKEWREKLQNEKTAAQRVLDIQDETWRQEAIETLDDNFTEACKTLQLEAAEQEAAFQVHLHNCQDRWRIQVAQIQLSLEDVQSQHMRACDIAQLNFERDMQLIALKEHEIETRTQCQHQEASERQLMAAAEKEGMELRLRTIRYEMAQHQRQRQDEFDQVWKKVVKQTLSWNHEKIRIRQKCLGELQALEGLYTRDIKALVPLGPTTEHDESIVGATVSLRQLLRTRIEQQLSIAQEELHDTLLDDGMEVLVRVCHAQQCNAEMALHDAESRLWQRRQRALDFLQDDSTPTAQVHPMHTRTPPFSKESPDKEPYLQSLQVDLTRFPRLAPLPHHVHPKDQAILAQLKQNTDLVQRLEAERKQFKVKTDESSRTIAKLEASIASMEEMMRIADEKARDDAGVIQLLQDKVKSCVVELPTKDVVPSVVAANDVSDKKSSLLRGWK
ncbi:hypothetical protein Ae201684_003112 [Aphanomyces euteiches]|uniref:Kinesin motor domain-containing protein n=1 Tax=Aphanomyces euteiches TaxID=100861 RepID=A0A6G0XNF8_9STRA|nr:hypothetical protein Ae201684_003112 [Aphanomyces euteiches]